jgi:TetR/AcrR family transcriptional repressor for divergent bdcA
VERAIANGELKASPATKVLPNILTTFFHGMTCETRDGVTSDTLDAAVTSLLTLWDINAVKRGKSKVS